MIRSSVYLCAIPELYWEPEDAGHLPVHIARFAADALGAERRISKGVNLENERPRYTLLCQRLESEVLASGLLQPVAGLGQLPSALTAGKLPAVLIDHSYLDFLRLAANGDTPERLGASFFPPDQVLSHAEAFEGLCTQHGLGDVPALQTRAQFFRYAAQAHCGVVEIQYPCAFLDTPDLEMSPQLERLRTQLFERDDAGDGTSAVALALSEEDLHEVEAFESGYKQRQVRNLSCAILQAIENGDPANFSNRSNDVIAEVLHRFVCVASHQADSAAGSRIGLTPAEIRIVYADGSEGRPFPIRCLCLGPQVEDNEPPLRAVLMSMRHLDLDRVVDLAWFRNREVSKTRTLAETDEYCYQKTLDSLDAALKEGPLLLHMYHTGFEPAVIGFYRGVVEALRSEQGGMLAVLPHYYRGKKGFELGSWWR